MSSETFIHVGTSGWSYDHWAGLFYPEGLKKNEWFAQWTKMPGVFFFKHLLPFSVMMPISIQ